MPASNKEQEIFYLLVAGSRNYDNYKELYEVLDFLLQNKQDKDIVIVSGGAKGADALAEKYADEKGYKKKIMYADWNRYGNRAGYYRNTNMHKFISESASNDRGCVCFWDMQSKGTKHNFELAETYHTPLRIYNIIKHCFV